MMQFLGPLSRYLHWCCGSICPPTVHFLSNWLWPYCGISWIIGISKHLWFRHCYCKKNWKKNYVLSWPNKTIPFKLLQRRCDIKDIHLSFDLDISNFRNILKKVLYFLTKWWSLSIVLIHYFHFKSILDWIIFKLFALQKIFQTILKTNTNFQKA